MNRHRLGTGAWRALLGLLLWAAVAPLDQGVPMGGTLTVQSQVDHGARFTLSLPVAPATLD